MDEEGGPADWRTDGGELIVYQESAYFYAQSRYDSSDQIESDAFTIEQIMAGYKEIVEEVTL